MKKTIKIIAGFTILFMTLSCSGSSKRETVEKLNRLKTAYSSDSDAQKAIELAEFYNSEYNSDLESIEEGLDFIEESLEKYSGNNRLLALQGNLFTLCGGVYAKKFQLSKAMENTNNGLELLDEALENAPDDWFVLLYHGINSVSLPRRFHKYEQSVTTLEILRNMEGIEETVEIQALYYLAKAYEINGNEKKSKEVLNELKGLYPDYKDQI